MTEESSVNTDEDRGRLLPNCSEWPHRPVYLQAGSHTQILDRPSDQPLPLGVPFSFESPLFKGKMLVRFSNVKSDDVASHQAYFAGRSRIMQTVMQGQFKKAVSMSDIYTGSFFKEPMKMVPPPFFMRLLNMLIPGAILDLASAEPKVVTLYGGSAKTVSVNHPGEEPDISAAELPEYFPTHNNVASANKLKTKPSMFRSIAERKRKLSNRTQAALYDFDPEKVYTLEIYDESLDYSSYDIKLPVYGRFNLSQAIGPQPMTLSAATSTGEIVYDFHVWHESIYRLKYPNSDTAVSI